MTTSEQLARELIGRVCLASLAGKNDEYLELANLIEEHNLLRAGIDAALAEITNTANKGSHTWHEEYAYKNSAAIVRKHTGVCK